MFWKDLEKKEVGQAVGVVGVEAEAGFDLLSWFLFLLGGKPRFQVNLPAWPLAVRRGLWPSPLAEETDTGSRPGQKTCGPSVTFPPLEVNLDMKCEKNMGLGGRRDKSPSPDTHTHTHRHYHLQRKQV